MAKAVYAVAAQRRWVLTGTPIVSVFVSSSLSFTYWNVMLDQLTTGMLMSLMHLYIPDHSLFPRISVLSSPSYKFAAHSITPTSIKDFSFVHSRTEIRPVLSFLGYRFWMTTSLKTDHWYVIIGSHESDLYSADEGGKLSYSGINFTIACSILNRCKIAKEIILSLFHRSAS